MPDGFEDLLADVGLACAMYHRFRQAWVVDGPEREWSQAADEGDEFTAGEVLAQVDKSARLIIGEVLVDGSVQDMTGIGWVSD